MKKLLIILILFINILGLAGCVKEKNEEVLSKNNFVTVKPDTNGKIIIDTKDITSTATFVNYKVDEIDGVTIQFIVVRGTDGKVRIAFNTCGACNPSPNAYFIQVGEYLQCQNCDSKFHIDKIGEEKDGCNPAPVEEKEETDNHIIISQAYADSYKEKFANWNGPKA